jgi:hypothetical protein
MGIGMIVMIVTGMGTLIERMKRIDADFLN